MSRKAKEKLKWKTRKPYFFLCVSQMKYRVLSIRKSHEAKEQGKQFHFYFSFHIHEKKALHRNSILLANTHHKVFSSSFGK